MFLKTILSINTGFTKHRLHCTKESVIVWESVIRDDGPSV